MVDASVRGVLAAAGIAEVVVYVVRGGKGGDVGVNASWSCFSSSFLFNPHPLTLLRP